ncbi:EcsC family protein [Paeniglutamicibacter terrestris]|uniref:EcsC family protein n=1 Tax=Paeniglutamicibacter terrestris TaxID=2723403 RepID=A0ABX1G8H3_9MICC|nr:EcsC family protein [Paeniglutamicibacter terrestris]NKG22006.1 EcsC family protein [Paeniglutamicibacter terrestris]
MSIYTDPLVEEGTPMSEYEGKVWNSLNDHWERRSNRRGLPNWASTALNRTGEVAGSAANRVADAVPEVVKGPIRRAGEAVSDKAARPAVGAVTSMLELVNDWALELNDPKSVEKLARKQGFELNHFTELREQDLKVCDRILTFNTLTWRTAGAVEGGAMGLLAMVPVAGIPVALTADILVIQVLSTSIASRIAYSYGYDAKDHDEQAFIQRLVQRSFMAQAAKVKPLRDAARAADAIKGRIRWSNKLRQDHHLVAALEKLLKHLGTGSTVPVKHVAKAVPLVGILIGAGVNSTILGNVAADARRYCQTRFLCEKYGLPLPAALATNQDEDPLIDAV